MVEIARWLLGTALFCIAPSKRCAPQAEALGVLFRGSCDDGPASTFFFRLELVERGTLLVGLANRCCQRNITHAQPIMGSFRRHGVSLRSVAGNEAHDNQHYRVWQTKVPILHLPLE
jgi:hypothetical protein